MPNRLTKIVTRNGDAGFTTIGDKRLSKDDLIIDVVGNLDELNSHLGMVLALHPNHEEIEACLTQIQQDLFDFGAEFHVPERIAINAEKIIWLENQLEGWNKSLPPLKEFVLPRGNPATAAMHVARTVCRRTERSLVRLHRNVTLHNPEMLRYLNRLSDLLFVASRLLARMNNKEELMWERQ